MISLVFSWRMALDYIWWSRWPSLTLLLGPALSRTHGGILSYRLDRLLKGCSRGIWDSVLGNFKKFCLKLAKKTCTYTCNLFKNTNNLRALNTTKGKTTKNYLNAETNNSPFWVNQQHNLFWILTRWRRNLPATNKNRTEFTHILRWWLLLSLSSNSSRICSVSGHPPSFRRVKEGSYLISTFW